MTFSLNMTYIMEAVHIKGKQTANKQATIFIYKLPTADLFPYYWLTMPSFTLWLWVEVATLVEEQVPRLPHWRLMIWWLVGWWSKGNRWGGERRDLKNSWSKTGSCLHFRSSHTDFWPARRTAQQHQISLQISQV